jgi:hypothetical protein
MVNFMLSNSNYFCDLKNIFDVSFPQIHKIRMQEAGCSNYCCTTGVTFML